MVKTISYILVLTSLFITSLADAQNKLISGEATVLMNDAEKTKPMYESEAYQLAINNAIDQAFGSSVLSNYERNVYTEMEGRSVGSHLDVRNNYLNSYPNGIWVEDKKVDYLENKDANGNWWLNCTVTGFAREMKATKVDFIAKTLDGVDIEKNETTVYQNGEQGFLYFKSAKDGYLVCFYDDMQTIQRCLPYNSSDNQQISIKNNQEYLFFSTEYANYGIEATAIDEIEFYTSKSLEYNQLYLIFSSEPIGAYFMKKAEKLDDDYSSFRSMTRENFHSWLQENRIRNPKLEVQIIGITINK